MSSSVTEQELEELSNQEDAAKNERNRKEVKNHKNENYVMAEKIKKERQKEVQNNYSYSYTSSYNTRRYGYGPRPAHLRPTSHIR